MSQRSEGSWQSSALAVAWLPWARGTPVTRARILYVVTWGGVTTGHLANGRAPSPPSFACPRVSIGALGCPAAVRRLASVVARLSYGICDAKKEEDPAGKEDPARRKDPARKRPPAQEIPVQGGEALEPGEASACKEAEEKHSAETCPPHQRQGHVASLPPEGACCHGLRAGADQEQAAKGHPCQQPQASQSCLAAHAGQGHVLGPRQHLRAL